MNKRNFTLLLLGFSMAAIAQTPQPRIFYSDLESGPNTGGENGKGAFVTIYGQGFGATQGSSTIKVGGGTVDNYRVWTDTKVAFQLGPDAATGPIVLTTPNSTSNGVPFTVRAGNIYCVSTSGSDSGAGTFAGGCWRTMIAARDKIAAGDIVYARNGVIQSAEDGRGWHASVTLLGSEGDNGKAGSPKAFVVYPGETATIGNASGAMYGLRSDNASYWVIAGWQLRGYTMAITMGNNFRVVGNEMQCPNGDDYYACAITNGSSNVKFYGNNVHKAGKTGEISKMYHAVYFSTDSNNIDAGWNWIHDSNACRGIQFHSSPLGGSSGQNQYNLSVHDNVIHDVSCDGINFATVDPSKGKVEAYNNIIFNAGTGRTTAAHHSCIFVAGTTNTGTAGKGTVEVYNNTMYNCGGANNYDSGAVSIGGNAASTGLFMRLRNNIILQPNGLKYIAPNTTVSQITGSNNLWFGNGGAPSQTSANIDGDPKFIDLQNHNFRLAASSPAVDKGVAVSLAADNDGNHRPLGSAIDIGAYEYLQGSAAQISCDVNQDGKVDSTDVQSSIAQALGQSACSVDLNKDGECNVVDVQRVVNASLGVTCRVGS